MNHSFTLNDVLAQMRRDDAAETADFRDHVIAGSVFIILQLGIFWMAFQSL